MTINFSLKAQQFYRNNASTNSKCYLFAKCTAYSYLVSISIFFCAIRDNAMFTQYLATLRDKGSLNIFKCIWVNYFENK